MSNKFLVTTIHLTSLTSKTAPRGSSYGS